MIAVLFLIGLVLKIVVASLTFHGDLIDIWQPPATSLWHWQTIGLYRPPLSYLLFLFLSPFYFLSTKLGFWVLKIPYLIFDLAILFLLLKMLPKKYRRKCLWLWWLNPINLYGTYAQGQMEIILGFAILLSVYVFYLNRKFVSTLLISVAGALKTMPLFVLPAVTIFAGKNNKQRFLYFFANISIPIILGFIFWEFSSLDVIKSYFPSPAAPRLELGLRIDVFYIAAAFLIGLVGYSALIFFYLKQKNKKIKYEEFLLSGILFSFIAFPADTLHRYIQFLPLLVFTILKNKWSQKWVWYLSLFFILGYVYVWPLQWGLIDHIYKDAANRLATREWLSPVIKYENLALLFRAIGDSILLYYALLPFRRFNIRISNIKNSFVNLSKRISS